jgi:hypothetical protein
LLCGLLYHPCFWREVEFGLALIAAKIFKNIIHEFHGLKPVASKSVAPTALLADSTILSSATVALIKVSRNERND